MLVTIDIKNVASETHPDDKVVFRSPVVREAAGGGLVSTADEVVTLVDGVGEIELVPGPVIVTFQCRGMADTRPKRGTVPDVGPVTVADVIGQNFTFTPEVVGAAQAARNQAVQAAADAEAAEVAAEGHAEAAGNSTNAAAGYAQEAKGYRDTASTHAQDATDQAGVATNKASEADASANTAANHASAADTARQGAVAAQGLAETARDEAETTVQTALDAALPTKADLSELKATNYIKGVADDLNALTSDNDFGMWRSSPSTLNAPGPGYYHVLVYGSPGSQHRIQKATRFGSQAVPSEHIRVLDSAPGSVWSPWERVDVRTDTTVGTRVFVGNTMIHGDTGRRSVPTLSTSLDVSTSNLHGMWIRRVGDLVTLTASGVWITGQWITESLPLGFRPLSGEYIASRGIATVDGNVRTFGNSGTLIRLNFGGPFPSPGSIVALNVTWHTADAWPTSLPGLPA